MGFRLREHTADVAVEATGATLGETFAAVADGLTAAMCETVPDDGERFSLTATGEHPEAALFEYLDELIYQRDVREVLPVDHEARVEGPEERETDGAAGPDPGDWRVEASARGVPFADVVARDVKAVTYSEMRLEHTGEGWEAYVVFDV
jgi:SHS2 domain-containing protein